MIHFTARTNLDAIMNEGLRTGMPLATDHAVAWTLAFYDVNPVFLGMEDSPFLALALEAEFSDHVRINVDTTGLPLVADLVCLVDAGAIYAEGCLYVGAAKKLAALRPFASEDGWLEIEHLLDPETDAARTAIRITGTAACIVDIEPSRLSLVLTYQLAL